MNSASLLRKATLAALQDCVLPDLQSGGARRLVTARLPLSVPAGTAVTEIEHPPLQETDARKVYPEEKRWDDLDFHTLRFPALYCVMEGEADLAMGVTASMLDALPAADKPAHPCGGYIVALKAPAYFLIPPGTPYRTRPPWQREEAHSGLSRLLIMRILPIGVLCNLTTLQDGEYEVPYSLLVKDNQLAGVTELLVDELNAPPADKQIVQAQLLTLMLRLKNRLSTQMPLLTDGIFSRFPDSQPSDGQAQPLHHSLIERIHEYIQLHLHEPLTASEIAATVQLTPDHLNRIFKHGTGTSLMSYVTRLRMESAQLLLRTSELSVQEIGRLVGYRHVSHFSRTFVQHTGYAPLKYRQQVKEEK